MHIYVCVFIWLSDNAGGTSEFKGSSNKMPFPSWDSVIGKRLTGSLKFLAVAFFESMNLSFCRKQQNGITDYCNICQTPIKKRMVWKICLKNIIQISHFFRRNSRHNKNEWCIQTHITNFDFFKKILWAELPILLKWDWLYSEFVFFPKGYCFME